MGTRRLLAPRRREPLVKGHLTLEAAAAACAWAQVELHRELRKHAAHSLGLWQR